MLSISRVLCDELPHPTIIYLGLPSPTSSCSGEEEDGSEPTFGALLQVHVSFLPSHLAPRRVYHFWVLKP